MHVVYTLYIFHTGLQETKCLHCFSRYEVLACCISQLGAFKAMAVLLCFPGPTDTTVSDFWQMIWDQKCPVIVMLTNIEENGRVCRRSVHYTTKLK